ncbi:HAUS augmin-like complex subunit 6 isoform X2 [Tyto alba]|uniref:HAUS augmin-like complex subunit 6 isoform X2 n=1 Tax=Tyto alba TaxID=56313 RepID=UPI001403CE5E|nr:HAUS augmin-like complex subunit 6 isoform X2 [Tyto alba]
MAAKREGKRLWLSLLALGFDPKADGMGVTLGPKMFVIPNNGAFCVISLFLFRKLDKSRAEKLFAPYPVGINMDLAFRKKCCIWLKDIESKGQHSFPHIRPSSFISPGGPKFIHLLYLFARHVVIEDMKINSIGPDIPFAEAVKLRPKDVYMANARCKVAYNKLLQILRLQDFIIQEYRKKSRILIREIKLIKFEYTVLKIRSCRMKQRDQNKNNKTERIQKVRSMWTLIMEMLTSLEKEKEVVDSVLAELESYVHRCILDGTDVAFSVPQPLVRRLENDIHEICSGNIYEGEKLNFLTVIQLLNEALRTLRDERCQPELKQMQVIEKKVMVCNKLLQRLVANRLKIEQQHRVSSASISRKQEDWEVKWKSFLGLCPFNLILHQYPVNRVQFTWFWGRENVKEPHWSKALPPLSFNLEERDEDIVPCQHVASVSDVCDTIHEVCYGKSNEALETVIDKSTLPPRGISLVPLELSKSSENRDVLIEKNLHIETCKGKKKPVPPEILKNGKNESVISEMENAGDHIVQTQSAVKKEDPLKKARDELAEEVARAVISGSPQTGEGKGMALEDLIRALAFNPFITRNQIPRTPEKLFTDVRSSWRKTIQTEGSSDMEPIPAEVTIEEDAMDATLTMEEESDSTLMCSTSDSDSENQTLLYVKSSTNTPAICSENNSRTNVLPSDHFQASLVNEMQHWNVRSPSRKTIQTEGSSDMEPIPAEVTIEEDAMDATLNMQEASDSTLMCSTSDSENQTLLYVKSSMNTPGICSENNSRTNVLPSDHFQASLVNEIQQQNVSLLFSSVSCEGSHLGILDETFPEEFDSFDSSDYSWSEPDFDVIDSTYIAGDPDNEGDIQKSKLDLQSPFNTNKVLKNTTSRSEEKLHQTYNGGESLSCKSDLNLALEKRERDEFCNPVELFSSDKEFTLMPSPESPNERKYSLSSLLVSCQQLEEIYTMVHNIPVELVHKLKGKEQLNENLGTKEPSSGQNL